MLVPAGAAPNTATWLLIVPAAASYQVYARWTAHPNRATDAKYTVNHAAGAHGHREPERGGTWNLLGTFAFTPARHSKPHRPGERLRDRRRVMLLPVRGRAQQRHLDPERLAARASTRSMRAGRSTPTARPTRPTP